MWSPLEWYEASVKDDTEPGMVPASTLETGESVMLGLHLSTSAGKHFLTVEFHRFLMALSVRPGSSLAISAQPLP